MANEARLSPTGRTWGEPRAGEVRQYGGEEDALLWLSLWGQKATQWCWGPTIRRTECKLVGTTSEEQGEGVVASTACQGLQGDLLRGSRMELCLRICQRKGEFK
eukprot:EG_transcript_40384